MAPYGRSLKSSPVINKCVSSEAIRVEKMKFYAKKKKGDAVYFNEGSLGGEAYYVCLVVVFGVTDSKT